MVPVPSLGGGLGQRILDVAFDIGQELQAKSVWDFKGKNLFFDPKTETVLVTDLYHKTKSQ